jgi:hypothetical protein
MGPEKEKYATWLDDIKELIMKKRAENIALRKVRELLEPGGKGDAVKRPTISDVDKIQSFVNEDQSVNNSNN